MPDLTARNRQNTSCLLKGRTAHHLKDAAKFLHLLVQRARPGFRSRLLLRCSRQLFLLYDQAQSLLNQILQLAAPQGGLGFGTAEQFVGDINRRPHALHLSILMRKCKGGSPRRVEQLANDWRAVNLAWVGMDPTVEHR